ncbi:MAG: nucleotidyltransferase domain-containing protein [Sediminibacterium sp.]
MVQNKSGLLSLLAANEKEILKFGIRKLELFGSFGRDQRIRETSDVDFLVEWEDDEVRFSNNTNAISFLEQITGRDVDLINRKRVYVFMAPYILPYAEIVLPVKSRPKKIDDCNAKRFVKSDTPYVQWLHAEIVEAGKRYSRITLARIRKNENLKKNLAFLMERLARPAGKIRYSFRKKHKQVPWEMLVGFGRKFYILRKSFDPVEVYESWKLLSIVRDKLSDLIEMITD